MRALLAVVVATSLTSVAGAADDSARVKAALAKAFPQVKIESVRPSPVKGFYEASTGGNIVYVSSDGRYVFTGDLLDTKTRTNLSEAHRGRLALNKVNAVPDDQMLVIGPATAKRTVTVFTDIDCPYCRKLHQEVPALNSGGVRVRYLFFPRAGEGSESFNKSVSVWCAKDRIEAMNNAKAGREVEAKTCNNPVGAHLQLAHALRLQGTPAIVLDTGDIIPGYVSAKEILGMLEKTPAQAKSSAPNS